LETAFGLHFPWNNKRIFIEQAAGAEMDLVALILMMEEGNCYRDKSGPKC